MHLVLKHGEEVDRLDALQLRVAVPLWRAHDERAGVGPAHRAGEVERERLEDGRHFVHVAAAHFAFAGLGLGRM